MFRVHQIVKMLSYVAVILSIVAVCQGDGYSTEAENDVVKRAGRMCPLSHPWVYYQGKFCCKYRKEDFYLPQGETCNGGVLSRSSACCKDGQAVECPHGSDCVDNVNAMCPISHPWAYYNGQHCCKYRKEKVYRPQGHKCDGGRLFRDSLCCKDNQGVRCPSKYGCIDSTKARASCPRSHPWVYYNGEYCCKYREEKFNRPQGKVCDGGRLSRFSACCKDDQSVQCPKGSGCVDTEVW